MPVQYSLMKGLRSCQGGLREPFDALTRKTLFPSFKDKHPDTAMRVDTDQDSLREANLSEALAQGFRKPISGR